MNFVVNFTDNIKLVYSLIDHEIVDSWAQLITKQTAKNLCPISHYHGYATDEFIQQRIDRLLTLADTINSAAPDRVIKHPINPEQWRHSLNVMHTHFPDLKNDSFYQHIWAELIEYNDIIHWLEGMLEQRWDHRLHDTRAFRITLDFNKSFPTRLPIPDSAYSLFTPYFGFGDLMLHYTHVGKHAQELFYSKDYECPAEQFVPQREYNASVRMHFFNNGAVLRETFDKNWTEYYFKRGGIDFWQLSIDDPKLALGYMSIGKLTEIWVGGSQIPWPITVTEMNVFRERLANTSVIDWTIN